jgi:hypothetical protein
VALTPTNDASRQDKTAQRAAAQEEALLREVDEAVRQDDLTSFASRYGKAIGAALVIGLGLFGGYLFWDHQQEQAREENSEALVKALDQLEAGNLDTANSSLAALVTAGGDTAALAKMQQAGLAIAQGKKADAIKLFDEVANDSGVAQPLRDAAAIRSVSANYDQLQPQQVIDRLKPLATPGNPWFGSAGELVAMAYLEQNKADLAGPLFAEISRDESLPETLRSRMRQMAGYLGVDAVDDISEIVGATDDGAPGDAPPIAAPAE